MSGRRHPIILCAVLTTRDTSFLSCAVPTPHCHAETQSAFHRGPADICKQLRRENSLFSCPDEEELLLYLLQQARGVSSPRGQSRSGCSCTLSCPDHFPQDLIDHTKKNRLSYFVGVVVYFLKY
ncbi:hypothetical protein XENOCAPTIV_021699 [Xenoophorus captivus]|uniref:Secreted protein n=1 Tax=Xenoophorus captivus TaxID=1517983 RepID=A0ABV0R9V3_9TELE